MDMGTDSRMIVLHENRIKDPPQQLSITKGDAQHVKASSELMKTLPQQKKL